MSEIDALKAQADLLGVTYKSNIGEETLRAKIQAKLNDEPDPEAPPAPVPAVKALTREQELQQIRQAQLDEQMALVRVRVTCLNPLKAQLRGEIFTAGNRLIGTVRKFVPFGEATDNGYHVPRLLLNEMKDRKFNSIKTSKGPNNSIQVSQRMVPEFAIEVLPPLTAEERAHLAAQQMAAAGL